MASHAPTAWGDMLTALRNANDGWAITVWADGGWKLWRTLDAKYAEGDPGWVTTIPVHQVANELSKQEPI